MNATSACQKLHPQRLGSGTWIVCLDLLWDSQLLFSWIFLLAISPITLLSLTLCPAFCLASILGCIRSFYAQNEASLNVRLSKVHHSNRATEHIGRLRAKNLHEGLFFIVKICSGITYRFYHIVFKVLATQLPQQFIVFCYSCVC
jgi:hypothetical protein